MVDEKKKAEVNNQPEVEEPVASVDEVDTGASAKEEKAEVPADSPSEKEESAEVQTESSDQHQQQEEKADASEEEETPFHENPKFQERIKEIEEKYGAMAKGWQMIQEVAQADPEFALMLVKKLEDAGKIPQGSYERAKSELALGQKIGSTQEQEAAPKHGDVSNELNKLLEAHPAFKQLIAAYEEQERQQQEAIMRMERTLQDFEARHKDIPNDPAVRRAIGAEAMLRMKKDPNLKFEDALEQAYRWVLHRDEVLKEMREKGELAGMVSNIQQGVASPTKGEGKPAKTITLSPEEARQAEKLGLTPEEYIKYSNPDAIEVE